jgi:type IV secretory pathway TrbL component
MLPNLKALSLGWKVAGVVLIAIAIFAAFRSCTATTNHKTDVAIGAAEEKGAATAAAAAATKGLVNVEKGNAAAAAVDRDDDARRAGCLRHSRTPENC